MVILVLSESMDKSAKICSKLEEQHHVCAAVQDIPELIEVLDDNKKSRIDLLICSYYAFSTVTYNPYESMVGLLKDKKIPFIFYNDPLLPPINRSAYWENSILKYHPFSTSIELSEIYRQLFMWLNINPSMQALLFGGADKKEEDDVESEEKLISLAKEIGIQDSRLELLIFFWKNRNKSMSVSDICISLWNRNDDACVQKLYTYVSNLRQSFYNCFQYRMQIIRTGKNKYMFSAAKRKLIDKDFSVRDFLKLPVQYKVDFK